MITATVPKCDVPATAVFPTAVAPAIGSGIVAAIHIPAAHAVYVACSRDGVLLADTYGPHATAAEVQMATQIANLRAHAHASGCTAGRLRRTLTDATRESR